MLPTGHDDHRALLFSCMFLGATLNTRYLKHESQCGNGKDILWGYGLVMSLLAACSSCPHTKGVLYCELITQSSCWTRFSISMVGGRLVLLRVNLVPHRDSSCNDSIGPLKVEQCDRIVELSLRLVTLI